MRPTDNLIGQRFGKLKVTGFAGYFPTSPGAPLQAYWTCECGCGKTMVRVKATSLTSHNTRSCGCLRSRKKSKMHLYWKWQYEKRRGTICEEWIAFEVFKAFMDKIGYTDRMRVKKLKRGGVLAPDNFYLS